MSGTSVTEIHRYPRRPEGFEEPLFATPESRRAVMEHLLSAPWLSRASDLAGRGADEVARRRRVPVRLVRTGGPAGVLWVVPREEGSRRRCSVSASAVRRVLGKWREVDRDGPGSERATRSLRGWGLRISSSLPILHSPVQSLVCCSDQGVFSFQTQTHPYPINNSNLLRAEPSVGRHNAVRHEPTDTKPATLVTGVFCSEDFRSPRRLIPFKLHPTPRKIGRR